MHGTVHAMHNCVCSRATRRLEAAGSLPAIVLQQCRLCLTTSLDDWIEPAEVLLLGSHDLASRRLMGSTPPANLEPVRLPATTTRIVGGFCYFTWYSCPKTSPGVLHSQDWARFAVACMQPTPSSLRMATRLDVQTRSAEVFLLASQWFPSMEAHQLPSSHMGTQLAHDRAMLTIATDCSIGIGSDRNYQW